MGPKKNKTQENLKNKSEKCKYYDRGYCRNGESCPDQHPDKVCTDINCFDDKCPLRHPNPCKFKYRYVFQKKKICLYSHVALENSFDNKLEELEKRLKTMEKEKLEFARKVETKFETLENKVDILRKSSEDKDKKIIALEKKLNDVEKVIKEKLE